MTTPDWQRIELGYRTGLLSIKELGRQHGVSDTAIRKQRDKGGWSKDLSPRVRHRVRESLVREGVRANRSELTGVPSDAAIVDEAAAIGVEVVRSHRSDIRRLREAAAGLLADLRPKPQGALTQWDGADEIPLIHRSRVIADLSAAMARLIPLERQAFGLDEERPLDGIQITWPLPKTALDD